MLDLRSQGRGGGCSNINVKLLLILGGTLAFLWNSEPGWSFTETIQPGLGEGHPLLRDRGTSGLVAEVQEPQEHGSSLTKREIMSFLRGMPLRRPSACGLCWCVCSNLLWSVWRSESFVSVFRPSLVCERW